MIYLYANVKLLNNTIMKSEKLLKSIRSVSGTKVLLEPFSFARLEEFYRLYQNSRHKWEKFLTLHFNTIGNAGTWISQQALLDFFIGFFIIEKSSGKIVGFISGDEFEDKGISRTRAIGIEYEGKGYAYEASKLFERLVKDAGYPAIICFCDEENERNKKLLLRDGFVKISKEKLECSSASVILGIYAKML